MATQPENGSQPAPDQSEGLISIGNKRRNPKNELLRELKKSLAPRKAQRRPRRRRAAAAGNVDDAKRRPEALAQTLDASDPRPAAKRSRQGERGGPKTLAGKARSSQNALKHGIFSTLDVIPEMESREEWLEFRQGFYDSWLPATRFEEFLVERLVKLGWRLKRFARHENALGYQQVEDRGPAPLFDAAYLHALELHAIRNVYAPGDGEDEDEDEDTPQARVLATVRVSLLREVSMIPHHTKRDALMQYEGHLHRQFIQTTRELEATQARRNGRHPFLGRFDTSVSPVA